MSNYWSWNGNTNGTATSPVQNLPNIIESFSIVPTGSSTVNVYKITASTSVCISPNNKALSVGDIYEGTRAIVLLPTEQIKVQVSGSVSYDFTLLNIQPV